MKKLLLIGATLVAVTLSSFAQVPFKSFSFIASDLSSITFSNTFMLTNLATAGATTNMTGTIYTNKYGTRTIVAGASTGSSKNLFQDIPFWTLRTGEPPYSNAATNNSSTVDQRASYANLAVKWICGSGADQAVTFVFTPIVNGKDECTTAGEEWAVSFTPVVSTTACLITNVPIWRWPGASGLRFRRATYSDTTAASQITLLDLSVNGFVPQ